MSRRPGVRALGIDPGTKRIGLAVSDSSGTIASPHSVLACSRSRQHDLSELAKVARDEEVDVIIVGLPINMDGSRGASARSAVNTAQRLATLVSVPVQMHDERRTTVNADQAMIEIGLNAVERRKRVDKVAAAVMLQSWLDRRSAAIDRGEWEGP